MTTRTNRIDEIFQDARELQADALEMLALVFNESVPLTREEARSIRDTLKIWA